MAILLYKWSFLLHWFFAGHPAPAAAAPHPLYVSVTEVQYNASDKNLEISCKIFADDFENTLAGIHHTKIDLTAPKDKSQAEKLVYDYLKNNLRIALDGKPVHLEFVGYEKENDAIWSYMQVSNTATMPKTIEVHNSLLYDAFDKQINLMHVTVGGTRKSTRLDYPDRDASFRF